jgi:hypothetical protein
MQNFEKLGAFYLGKRHDTSADQLTDELTLYDSKDLTTHAVIIGMTGSGKTGLGIGIIEEAALDHIPVIAIDPKGDLGNLLLTFPALRPADFEPWIDPRAAADAGQTTAEFADTMANLWKNGLLDWGQTPERITNLRAAADMAIYTPGSTAGLPISVLREFAAPPPELLADKDMYRERVQGTATSILTLLDVDADPLTSREHILLANVLDRAWQAGHSLDLAGLIAAIQAPGFDRIGVMDLDTFYPAKERFALAMRLNNLLAAPGFDAWMQGPPLAMDNLLHSKTGKPRVSVMSIAHLSDGERMFFVTMLLNELIAWMRSQPGSSTVRAILYMDEVFGYMPPVANPPSKQLLLTLLKQARAFGVGLVLSTQNPVDLDYKGLSNTGTWFIGRLQTQRDKARVRDGLRGAAGSDHLDGETLEQTLSGLGKRQFLLHNVHEKRPVIFQTRWVMSYLAGPLTRDQISRLTVDRPREADTVTERPAIPTGGPIKTGRPVTPPEVKQYFVPAALAADGVGKIVYYPRILTAGQVRYSRARPPVNEKRPFVFSIEAGDDPMAIDWSMAEPLDIDTANLAKNPTANATFAECAGALIRAKSYAAWEKDLRRWLRTEWPLLIYKSPHLKATSLPTETERDFRIRLQQLGNEARDLQVGKLRKRSEGKVATLEGRLLRAQQKVEREEEQASGQKIDAAISFGTAVLGALLGRKTVSATSASRMGTAVRKAGRVRSQSGDVRRAEETAAKVKLALQDLQEQFDRDVEALDEAYDAQTEALTEVVIQPKATDIHVRLMGIGWFPYADIGDGRLIERF